MFGRSGQMFPRRAYHDAIYEESYGSDGDGECCCSSGRGGRALGVLCWFLSVVILLGLAASVILTVFFVLKSRSLMGNKPVLGDGLSGEFLEPDNDLVFAYTSSTMSPKNLPTTSQSQPSTKWNSGTREINETMVFPTLLSSSTESFEQHNKYKSINRNKTNLAMVTTPVPIASSKPTRRAYSSPNRTTTVSYSSRTISSTLQQEKVTSADDLPSPTPPIALTTTTKPSVFQLFFETMKQFQNAQESPSSSSAETPSLPVTTINTTPLPSIPPAEILFSMPPLIYQNTTPRSFRKSSRFPVHKSFSSSTSSTENQSIVESIATTEKDYFRPESSLESFNNESLEPTPVTENTTTTASSTTTVGTKMRKQLLERIIQNLSPKFKNKSIEFFSSQEAFEPKSPNFRIKTKVRKMTTTTLESTDDSDQPFLVTPTPIVPEETLVSKISGHLLSSTTPTQPSTNSIQIVPSPDLSPGIGNETIMDILVGSEDHKTLITQETESGIITSAILPLWFLNSNKNSSGSEENGFKNKGVESSPSTFFPTTSSINTADLQSQETRLHYPMSQLSNSHPLPPFHYNNPQGIESIFGFYPSANSQVPLGDQMTDSAKEESSDEISDSNGGDVSHIIDIAFDPEKSHPEIVIEPDVDGADGEDSIDQREQLSEAASFSEPQVVNVNTTTTSKAKILETESFRPSQIDIPDANDEDSSIKGSPEYEDQPFRRQPVERLDQTLYKDSEAHILIPSVSSTNTYKQVYQVYPETTTFVTPSVETRIQENSSVFVPPEPMNFHSNAYNFNPSLSLGGFTPMDPDWRPVAHGSPSQAHYSTIPSNTYSTQFTRQTSTSTNPIKPSQPIPPPMSSSPSIKFQDSVEESHNHPGIDRSKYKLRPAPPPILMRKSPNPFAPNRRKSFQERPAPPPPPQFMNPQQQLLNKQRMYQQHLMRVKSQAQGGGERGKIHWPIEKNLNFFPRHQIPIPHQHHPHRHPHGP